MSETRTQDRATGDTPVTAEVDVERIARELFVGDGACHLSVLVPAYDEAESLPELVERVHDTVTPITASFEILVVDDGSSDGTRETVEELQTRFPRLQLISFLRNYGKSAALAVGFERARGDVIVTMDADLQDDPDEIPALLSRLADGYDLVSGWKQARKDPFVKTSTSKLFNAVTRSASGLDLHDFNCGLKAYRRACARSLQVYGELHRYLPVLAHVNGFRVTELPVRHHARQHGVTKFGRSRFLNGMFDLLTVMFLSRQRSSPLHFFGRLGLLFGVVGGAILLWFLGVWVVEQALRVRPMLLLGVALVLVAVQFVSLGLLAELFVASRHNTQNYQVRERGPAGGTRPSGGDVS